MLTAKEAREKLDKVIMEERIGERMDDINDIMISIEEAIQIKRNWIKLANEAAGEKSAKSFYNRIALIRSLGYTLEYGPLTKTITTVGESGNEESVEVIVNKREVLGPWYNYSDRNDPLMCWTISW
jgi:hypothetical protein